jgi:hypothetical protein
MMIWNKKKMKMILMKKMKMMEKMMMIWKWIELNFLKNFK